VVDFTSSLYLGLEHPSAAVAPWRRLTSGAPAALAEPEGAVELAAALADLIGGERALLMPSTLHLFVDFFTSALSNAALFWDEALYPVARWGIELAARRGVPAAPLPHLGEGLDAAWFARHTPPGRRPVIVTDGFCTGCGREAPLGRYVEAVRRRSGLVVIDDTQALGLFGASPSLEDPFGVDGGGSLRRQNLAGAPIVVGASLAKSFGVPLAVVTGPARVIAAFAERSAMRSHTSPPSAPLIHAGRAALALSARGGGDLRRRLARRIDEFRRAAAAMGRATAGGVFPVQSVMGDLDDGEMDADPGDETLRAHEALEVLGVRTVITRPACRRRRALTFVLRANHRRDELEHALRALSTTVRPRHPRAHFPYFVRQLSPGGLP
jgi:8-amino-7-oxononanoate synthase